MAEPEFEPFKLEIERLYVHENNTLAHVKEYMESKYSLVKSTSQYSRQLKKWGFAKGHIKAAEWNWIGDKMNKRKLNEDKESEFHIGGNQVDIPKVKKAKYREAYSSSIARFGPSPNTPEGLLVCTPTSPGMHLIWNGATPWLRFVKLLNDNQNGEASSPSSSLTIRTPRDFDALSRTVNHELMHRLSTIIPWDKLNHPPNIHSSSRTSAALSILMPEEFAGQHDIFSTTLTSSANGRKNRFGLELFLLSNNITSQGSRGRTEESIKQDDERVIQMLSDSGWKDLKHIQILLSTREPTAEAIAERVFSSALRLIDVDAVKMMLEAGMDPNNPLIEAIPHGVLTPLQFAARSQHERSGELIDILISHGADVDYSCNDYPPLFYAIHNDKSSHMYTLMSHGAIATSSCLSAATGLKDIEAFIRIADSCVDVNARTGWQSPSALAEAVEHQNIEMIQILLSKGANVNDLVAIEFEGDITTTTVLGRGVQSHSINVIRALLVGCDELNPEFDGLPYVSPIVLAMGRENIEVTLSLLQAGVDIKLADGQGEMTLLERATEKRLSVALCKILIDYGAQIDRPISDEKCDSSPLQIALKHKSVEVVELLINAGARLNDEYNKPPYSALGAALEHGDVILINRLLTAGATFVGSKLQKVGSLGTAMYLQASGILKGILKGSGRKILAAALLDKNFNPDLVQYLLEHDADHGDDTQSDKSTPSKQSPLGAAIRARKFDLAKTLLDRGAVVTDIILADAVGEDSSFLEHLLARFRGSAPTAVGAAIQHGEYLDLFQEAGVDPTGVPQSFEQGWYCWDELEFELPPPESVLEIAVVSGESETVQILLEWKPWTPRLIGRALTFAILLQLRGLAELILPFNPDHTQEITIKYGSYEDDLGEVIGEKETYTPLQAAVKEQMIPIARELMEKGDVDHLGDGARRRTALQHAVEKGNMELINLLLDHQAKVDGPPARDGGATAFQIACLKGYIGIARRLLDLGANVNEAPAEREGRTALQGAAEYGRIDMLQILLDEGALIVGDGEPQYRKAVELAERNGHHAAARLMKSWRQTVSLSPSAQ
ncbi:unnamed protein product [Penicillium salamii]|uniref:Clr5 domain-containing protein n=1 Tax=Penicillium salamii TaxID=1612424 RepID=A0A9W4NRT1_9EURO|nr:unnamed protein product [Penicillium salamii]CAG8123290.1 unnamed protein product [Penicillium salamii]CAG8227098.1 unnamed protein product [Penicillium salamii]CAG8307979.1 unnamed protein product [Penicillium salamii]CAG8329734.1 unnamed protein product [Penicillium salamii]